MLHLVNKSPFEKCAFESCLRLAQPGSSILLLEDGIYAAQRETPYAKMISARMGALAFYALGPDIVARGLSEAAMTEGVRIVDHAGFVDLVVGHETSLSWL